MPVGLPQSSRGRHVRPRRRTQPLLAGLLAVSLGGPLAGLAAAGVPDPQDEGSTDVVLARSAAEPMLDHLIDREVERISRERPPVEAPPVVPPPPPPPPAVPVLPGCTGGSSTEHANGRIPASAMCAIPGHSGHRLVADAARAFVALSDAYRADTGKTLCITDTYRSYSAQVALRRAKGRLAATPGRSNHGTGIAVDFCGGIESFGTAAHRWMQARAGEFGWVHPSWAGPNGSKPEPWHWEYRG